MRTNFVFMTGQQWMAELGTMPDLVMSQKENGPDWKTSFCQSAKIPFFGLTIRFLCLFPPRPFFPFFHPPLPVSCPLVSWQMSFLADFLSLVIKFSFQAFHTSQAMECKNRIFGVWFVVPLKGRGGIQNFELCGVSDRIGCISYLIPFVAFGFNIGVILKGSVQRKLTWVKNSIHSLLLA
jgi:hypothetical protein